MYDIIKPDLILKDQFLTEKKKKSSVFGVILNRKGKMIFCSKAFPYTVWEFLPGVANDIGITALIMVESNSAHHTGEVLL